MRRYFFHIHNDHVTLDEDGTDLRDNHAAVAYATRAVRELAAESVEHGRFVRHHRVEVHTRLGLVATVRFDEAVKIN